MASRESNRRRRRDRDEGQQQPSGGGAANERVDEILGLMADTLRQLRALAEGLAARIEEDDGEQPRAALPPLSPRETQAVRLVAAGFTAKEIARRMRVEIRTVDTFLDRAKRKLGVERRAELVAWFVEQRQ